LTGHGDELRDAAPGVYDFREQYSVSQISEFQSLLRLGGGSLTHSAAAVGSGSGLSRPDIVGPGRLEIPSTTKSISAREIALEFGSRSDFC
jgi:hypothetical protein